MNKRDFGSFHSSNVQELLQLSEKVYNPPSFPFELPDFYQYDEALAVFGKTIKSKHFYLQEDCTFLNHGAFGAVLKEALDAAQQWQKHIESQPLRFYDRELLPHLVWITRRLAKFVGCDCTDLLLMPNVTTAVNCVVKNLKLKAEDIVYCLNVRYGAVYKLIKHVCEEAGAHVQEETLSFPISGKQQIIDVVKSSLKPATKLAIFDHIPSNAPFILPIKEIIDICHERNIAVLIDGAHALGALPLDLNDLGADYYVSNAHKWFCCPKGCAFMYVAKKHHSSTRPLVISHGFGSGFNSEFIWSGLRDYSPFLALHTVIDFWEKVGVTNMRSYMYDIIRQACTLLCGKWKTRLLAHVEMFGTMACIQLPEELYQQCTKVNYNKAEVIQNQLYHKYNIEVPIKSLDGHLYVRISAHIYNHISEYEVLADAVLELTNDNFLLKQSELSS